MKILSPQPRVLENKSWPSQVKSALLHVIALAQHALAYARGWAATSSNQRVRLAARVDQLEQEIALLRESSSLSAQAKARSGTG